jgi:hypothetical protein
METNNVTQWVIIGAAVLVLVIGGAWLALRGGNANEPESNEKVATTTPATTTVNETNNIPKGSVTATSDGESVSVAAQDAGTSVVLQGLELTRASWVAVRDDMSILGAGWFPSSATGGTVKLQRATQSGKTYRVVIYVDDGDKKFDYKTDKLITVDGAPVGASFTTN